MKWKYSSEKRDAVFRNDGVMYEFRLIVDDDIQAWMAEGNEPDPPDPPLPTTEKPPTIDERLRAAETLINLLLDEGGV